MSECSMSVAICKPQDCAMARIVLAGTATLAEQLDFLVTHATPEPMVERLATLYGIRYDTALRATTEDVYAIQRRERHDAVNAQIVARERETSPAPEPR